MKKELYSDFIDTLRDALDSLKVQSNLEKDYEHTISKVCAKKKNGIIECDIYPFLGKNPDETKKATLIKIIEIVYGEDAYKRKSIINLLEGASRNLTVPVTINSDEELIEFFIKAGNMLNNQFISMNDRKAYGTVMKGVQTGIAKSAVILGKRKSKIKLCIDTLNDILHSVKKETLINIKNEFEFYTYLDEILYVIGEDKGPFSELLKVFINEYNKDVKKDALDKKIMKYYIKIEKTCDGNLKNIYKVMPKYTDPDFNTYMDGIDKLFEEKNPECAPTAAVFTGLHRFRKIKEETKEGKRK